MLWPGLILAISAIASLHGACFLIALYETLNQQDARQVRLTVPGLLAGLRTLVPETVGILLLVLLVPFGWLPWPRARGRVGALPVVCVPGWAMNRACFLLLRHRLRRDGWSEVRGVNYRSVYGDILTSARRLRDAVETCCAETGAARVALVAHGVGGIVCRAYLRHLGGGERVAKVITLGSPHRGSKLFALSLDPMLEALREGSSFLADLADADPIPGAVDFTAIYASFDTVVVPAAGARYPGVGNIEVEGVGHLGLLWSRRVYELVRENLEDVRAGTRPSLARRDAAAR